MKLIKESNSHKKKNLKEYFHIKDGKLKIYSDYLKKFVYYPIVEKDDVDWSQWAKVGFPAGNNNGYFHPECKKCQGFGSIYGYDAAHHDSQFITCPNCGGSQCANFAVKRKGL